jgi:uncharacterized protein
MSAVSRYRQPTDLPSLIPVFPLRGAILLPRSNLPLNVFEPRYLVMIEHALRGDRVIGIIQPKSEIQPKGEVEYPTEKSVDLKPIGCIGRITSYQETDDNRLHITITGISRFRVVDEPASQEPFRTCQVNYSAFRSDFVKGDGEEEVDRGTLLRVLKTYLDVNSMKADWESIHRAGNEFLVNTLSVISPYGAEEKQALLEAPNLKARAEVLIALAEMELATREGGSGTALQ